MLIYTYISEDGEKSTCASSLCRPKPALGYLVMVLTCFGNCIRKRHQAASALISRVIEVAGANAPRRADAPVPDAGMFLAALMPALAAWPQATQRNSAWDPRLAAAFRQRPALVEIRQAPAGFPVAVDALLKSRAAGLPLLFGHGLEPPPCRASAEAAGMRSACGRGPFGRLHRIGWPSWSSPSQLRRMRPRSRQADGRESVREP